MKLIRESYNGCKIEFVYSPFFEMLCSLHVLSKPQHHIGRLEWAEKLKAKMCKKLFKTLDYFSREFNQWCDAMDFCGEYDSVNGFSIIEALEFIEALDINRFSYIMLGSKIPFETIQDIISDRKSTVDKDNISNEYMKFLNNPYKAREKFISCLKEYYYCHFQDKLKYIEPILVRSLKRHKALSEKLDFWEYVDTLHSRIEVNSDIIHFHKYTRFDVPLKDLKGITVSISSFIDPHLLIGLSKAGNLGLTIRLNLNNQDEHHIPTDLHEVMKSLSDKTRLKILKSIYQKSECTQELAKSLGLTEACISKHLKVLYKSGLVEKERRGNFIFYKINCMEIDRVPMNIYQFLDS
ncbi:metalloregulator ArsR/SmtB family transcription factor [Wukongibacter baidiensis]|uniref:ArsR/SmtB family transcription factor n=1 Tax=Wukongibacter baidiensis TaxID=1723361 RepID=UPI003D7FF84E